MSKCTTGEWRASGHTIRSAHDDKVIGFMGGDATTIIEDLANARLAAAAKDLLGLARNVLATPDIAETKTWRDLVRDVIEKATGKRPKTLADDALDALEALRERIEADPGSVTCLIEDRHGVRVEFEGEE